MSVLLSKLSIPQKFLLPETSYLPPITFLLDLAKIVKLTYDLRKY